jgi:hypothetical protein
LQANGAADARLLFVLRSVEARDSAREQNVHDADSSRDRFGNTRSKILAGVWLRPASVMVLGTLCSAGIALACGHAHRATITTHLVVFALGALYGGLTRKKQSRARLKLPNRQKPGGSIPGAPREATPKRRFVKRTRRSDF